MVSNVKFSSLSPVIMVMLHCVFCIVAALSAPVAAVLENLDASGADTRDLYIQLLNRVENLETRDKQQQAEIDTLRSELDTERQRTSKLEGIISALKKENERTAADVAQSKSQDSGKISTETNARGLRSEIVSGGQGSRIRRQDTLPLIAFQATLSSHLEHVGVHQIVAFDNVLTNIGGAYNPHIGSFAAPVPGVYVFSTTLMGHDTHEFNGGIAKNGIIIANLYVRGVESIYGSDSATVFLHLNKGDDVDVQVASSDKTVNGDHYSMFGGFLLHADQPSEGIIGK